MTAWSLLCRLVALVPAPRIRTVRYLGVVAAAPPSGGLSLCPSQTGQDRPP